MRTFKGIEIANVSFTTDDEGMARIQVKGDGVFSQSILTTVEIETIIHMLGKCLNCENGDEPGAYEIIIRKKVADDLSGKSKMS